MIDLDVIQPNNFEQQTRIVGKPSREFAWLWISGLCLIFLGASTVPQKYTSVPSIPSPRYTYPIHCENVNAMVLMPIC